VATIPTRIDQALFDAAKAAGELQSRSAAQQLDHWARIGRELESSPSVTYDSIARVLAGQEPYDALSDREQAIVRVAWDERITERISGLDFENRLQAGERPWAEADADGNLVVRHPAPSRRGA
jgi:ParD-like antitoxin of type II bacterial toxin-antitoxin system